MKTSNINTLVIIDVTVAMPGSTSSCSTHALTNSLTASPMKHNGGRAEGLSVDNNVACRPVHHPACPALTVRFKVLLH